LRPEGCNHAIVSHRWTEEEVSFEAIPLYHSGEVSSLGWTKIFERCQIARKHGFEWVWIDTCCIYKTSSAELSEEINSIYSWYQQATECFVFLSDLASLKDRHSMADAPMHQCGEHTSPSNIANLVRSDWFERGWTLQELLAPSTVLFHNIEFEYIGSKTELREHISEATQITAWYLTNPSEVPKATVATRMRWAWQRDCTSHQ
jgi:hypothetical protein